MSQRRILYIQYTNPTAYPPLEHSSQILAEQGWQVRFLGTNSAGDSNSLQFPSIPGRELLLTSYCPPGLLQKLHYARYFLWCWLTVVVWRPRVAYASDSWSYPIAYSLSFVPWLQVVMHEHDTPANSTSLIQRVIMWSRRRLVKKAAIVICPQQARAKQLQDLSPARLNIVFNCPSKSELVEREVEADLPNESTRLRLWFHGSIVPTQLPRQVIQAMSQCDFKVTLSFAGYETIGHQGYVSELLQLAKELGLEDCVEYVGAIPTRAEMYRRASQCDVGLVLFSMGFREPMVGASNKPFDYLACGLALLVPATDEFNEFFVARGCALNCNSEQSESIAQALKQLAEDPRMMDSLASKGQELLNTKWNYEDQFQPVLELLNS